MTNRKGKQRVSASDPDFQTKSKAIDTMMAWDQIYLVRYAYRLKQKLEAAEMRISDLEVLLRDQKAANSTVATKNVKKEVFKADWPYSKKIFFIFSTLQRPLTAFEVDDFLCKHDSTYKSYQNRRSTLYGILNRAVKMKIICSVEITGDRHRFYCFSEWLNNFNQLLPEYKAKINFFKE